MNRKILLAILAIATVAGCSDEEREAGLTGENPVELIKYQALGSDPLSNVSLSIDSSGRLTSVTQMQFDPPITRHRQVDPRKFRELASELRTLRAAPATKMKSTCDAPYHHAPSTTVVWVYRDGQQGQRASFLNCAGDASNHVKTAVGMLKRELSDNPNQ